MSITYVSVMCQNSNGFPLKKILHTLFLLSFSLSPSPIWDESGNKWEKLYSSLQKYTIVFKVLHSKQHTKRLERVSCTFIYTTKDTLKLLSNKIFEATEIRLYIVCTTWITLIWSKYVHSYCGKPHCYNIIYKLGRWLLNTNESSFYW